MEFSIEKNYDGYFITINSHSSIAIIAKLIYMSRPDLLGSRLCQKYYGWYKTYPMKVGWFMPVYFDQEYYARCAIDEYLEPLYIMNLLTNNYE